MTSRTRTRKFGDFTGYATYNGTTQTRDAFLYQETCVDVVGNYPNPNPFSLTERDGFVGTINGTCAGYLYDNWPIVNGIVTAHIQKGATLGSLVTKALAATNPSEASILLPTSLYELKDLPNMVRWSAGSAGKRVANAHLNYQFGWKPLLSDLKKLLDFTSSVERKMQELESLSKHGLHRTAQLGCEEFSSAPKTITLNSTLATVVTAKVIDVTVRRNWATVFWRPSTNFPSYLIRDSRFIREKARRLVLGLDSSQINQNIWNAMPWSWLVDWFAGIDELLRSTNNSVAYASGPVCMMQTATTTRYYTDVKKPAGAVLSKLSSEYVTKKRELFSPTPKVELRSFLNGRRLSILGSLAILKGR